MSDCSILDWLKATPDIFEPCKPLSPSSRKRRRPLTPESPTGIGRCKMSARGSSSPSKRHQAEDLTPRPSHKRFQTGRSLPDHSVRTPSQASSTRSGNRSPQKHLNNLGRSREGIEIRELVRIDQQCPTLRRFRNKMRQVSLGQGILSPSLTDIFTQHPNEGVAEMAFNGSFSEDRDTLGLTPMPKDVLGILDAAVECQENFHAEPSWNVMVHNEVLKLALRGPDHPAYQNLVNFMPCTTATLIDQYVPKSHPSKKVDFCMYLDPLYDATESSIDLQSIIRDARDQLPEGVINHTNYFPLRERPIALSIETKTTGEGWDDAALQIGIWQAAHWNLLDNFRYDEVYEEPSEEPSEEESQGPSPPNFPTFLPGIIIQGHDWNLVLATREDRKTKIWTKICIGSTNHVTGIYQIICAIQVLRQWAIETYWPALKHSLLEGLEPV